MNDLNLDTLSVIVSQSAPVPYPNCRLAMIEALPLDQNPAAVYLANLKKSSRQPQKCALETIARILSNGEASCFELDWPRVRYQHTALVRSQLMDGYAPATANRFLCALRGTLEEAWLLGQMSAEDYHRAVHLSPVIGETLPAGRELTASEIRSLLQNCWDDPRSIGTRDAAVIAIMYSGGLRREEVTKLDLDDYDDANRKLLIHGKRSKERAVYLAKGAVIALNDWLEIRGNQPGPVFLEVNKGGNLVEGKRITTQAIYYLLKSRAKRAGVDNFSPHDIRRTFVSDLLEAGVDIATVARMAGHSSVDTTARYDRRPEQAKQRAAMLIKVPYR